MTRPKNTPKPPVIAVPDDAESGWIEFVYNYPGLRSEHYPVPRKVLRHRVTAEVSFPELVEAFAAFALAVGYHPDNVKWLTEEGEG